MLLMIVVCATLSFTTGQASTFSCRPTEKVIRVEIMAAGCSKQTVTTNEIVCTHIENTTEVFGNQTDDEPCLTWNHTEVTTTLSCFDGYQNHSTSVPLQIEDENRTCRNKVKRLASPDTMSYDIYKYAQPVIVVVGLAGNALSFLVMTSKGMRQFSFCVYLKTLAVIDSLVLLHYGMTYVDIMAYENPVFGFRMTSFAGCMIYIYLVRVAQLVSVWCVVAFTVDRALAICKPFFSRQYATVSRARVTVGIISLAMMLSQIYHPILLDPDTEFCHDPFSIPLTAAAGGALAVLTVISRFATLMVLPFVIVLACNISVITAVKRRKFAGLVRETSNGSSKPGNNGQKHCSDAEVRMSLNLLSVSITFLLLSLPDAAIVLVDMKNMLAGVDGWYLRNKGARCITRMVFSLNFAINYLLYGIAFRKQVMICSSCRKDDSSEISTS